MEETPETPAFPPSLKTEPYDYERWLDELDKTKQKRSLYESLVHQFPTMSRAWLEYLRFEIREKEFKNVETLFARCLRSVLDVDLWRFYLDYVMNTNKQGLEDGAAEARSTMIKAYEFALNHVGCDVGAAEFWLDYVNFLKSGQVM